MRGFIIFFTENSVNYLDCAHHQVIPAVGGSESEVAHEFEKSFAGKRRLLGVISLEEIEHHRAMIVEHALLEGIVLEKKPLQTLLCN